MKLSDLEDLELSLTENYFDQVIHDTKQWMKDLKDKRKQLEKNKEENKEEIANINDLIDWTSNLYDYLDEICYLPLECYNDYLELKASVDLSEKNNFYQIARIVVHDGIFHGDDVMCVALAKVINPNIEVIRTSDPNKIEEYLKDPNTIVCDIGSGILDHHQEEVEIRETDGRKHAACGLLAERIRDLIFPDEDSYKHFNWTFIMPFENADNFGETNSLFSAVANCRPAWDEENYDAVMEAGFIKAVNMLYNVAQDFLMGEEARIRAKDTVLNAMKKSKNQQIVVLEQYCPWGNTFVDTPVRYAIFPSLRGGFSVQTVQRDYRTRKRDTLPKEWLTSPPLGCNFVHQDLFIASFDTKESAINAAERLVGKGINKNTE